MKSNDTYERVKHAVDALKDETKFVDALQRDGWSQQMAQAGFRKHAQTWDVERAFAQVDLDRAPVESALHIWPALPGAGVSPWIYSALCGVPNLFVKSSRRGSAFAEFFCDAVSGSVPTTLFGPSDDWADVASTVVASGSDETIAEIRKRVSGRVVGYGHRVSLAIVDAETFTERDAARLADDVVMWRQTGCFSARSLVLVGGDAAKICDVIAVEFDAALDRLNPRFTTEERAHQVRQFATSQFLHPVHGTDRGWVERRDGPTDGGSVAPCVLTVHRCEPGGVESMIAIPKRHRQGVALKSVHITERDLMRSGFTRVCELGALQAPPIDWPHDGMSNVEWYYR